MPLEVIGTKNTVRALFAANTAGFKRSEAIRFKHGVLSPGAYIDNRKLPSHPGPWDTILTRMEVYAKKLRQEYDVIAAVATGGIAHATVMARSCGAPLVIVKKQEKDRGLGGLIDGDTKVLRGARTLLVEDMSSTFESSLKAMRALDHEGASVTHTIMISTWDLPDFQKNVAGHNVHALCTGAMLLDHAVEKELVDGQYEKVLRNWLVHPEDETWVHDGTWVAPRGETFSSRT
jgi:orotate phosphoribosyltransferase